MKTKKRMLIFVSLFILIGINIFGLFLLKASALIVMNDINYDDVVLTPDLWVHSNSTKDATNTTFYMTNTSSSFMVLKSLDWNDCKEFNLNLKFNVSIDNESGFALYVSASYYPNSSGITEFETWIISSNASMLNFSNYEGLPVNFYNDTTSFWINISCFRPYLLENNVFVLFNCLNYTTNSVDKNMTLIIEYSQSNCTISSKSEINPIPIGSSRAIVDSAFTVAMGAGAGGATASGIYIIKKRVK